MYLLGGTDATLLSHWGEWKSPRKDQIRSGITRTRVRTPKSELCSIGKSRKHVVVARIACLPVADTGISLPYSLLDSPKERIANRPEPLNVGGAAGSRRRQPDTVHIPSDCFHRPRGFQDTSL